VVIGPGGRLGGWLPKERPRGTRKVAAILRFVGLIYPTARHSPARQSQQRQRGMAAPTGTQNQRAGGRNPTSLSEEPEPYERAGSSPRPCNRL
jgi:hypothetical protein